MATTNDLKHGMTPNLDGQLWNVVDRQHVKPGKGGAFVVPPFITTGEKIKVDTRADEYLGRA